MERLFIFNGDTEELITVAGFNEGMMPFYSAPSNEQLNKDFTLEFSVPANHTEAVHIKEGNIAGYLDMDGDLQAFNIYKIEEVHSGSTLEIVAYAEHLFYELLDDVVEDLRVAGGTADEAMTKALTGSRWQKGTVAELGTADVNFYYNNGLNNVREIVNAFGGELKFRLTYDAGKITGRYVDLLARRGADTGKRFEYTKDLTSVKRTLDATDVKTALYGRGKASELDTGGYSRLADFADVVWTTPTNPTNKPAGQKWVGDTEALALYGRANKTKHRTGVVEFSEIEDPALLLQATWEYLQTVNKPRLTYEVSGIDLEFITGLSHEAVRLGDTVFIIDTDLNVTVEARVIEITRNIDNPAESEIKLGNFIPLFTNIATKIDEIEKRLNEKEGIWDSGSTPITDGDIAIEAPLAPTNVTASGLFEMVNIKWDFDASIKVAGYEVFGSQVINFTADASNLLWRGKAGGFSHRVAPNQTWYYRVKAFNANGDRSALSPQVTATTAKITGTYIADATIGNALIKDVSADKITFGTLDGYKADIVNLNADNIVAGKVKAQFVEIGSNTTFALGYDPTKKLQTVFQTTPPTDKNVIWVDTTDPANVQWKVWDAGLNDWRLGPSGPRGPQGLQGIQGPQGDQGLQGPAGTSSYTHIAYATNATGTAGFSTSDSVGKTYIGMYVDSNPTDSTDPTKYAWTLIKGADGAQGIQGPQGEDGLTPYLHIAYATNATGTTGFSTTDATGKTYIGTYTDYTSADSTNPASYTWALIKGEKGDTGATGPQGIQGPKGADGASLFTWVKYADTSTGGGMSDSPTGKKYIGLAYNKTTATESATATDYTWSLIQGEQGVQGPPGDDGVTTYTWIKYADDASGNGMSDSPANKRYLGIAYNKTTATESTNKADYAWSPLYDNVQIGGVNLVKGTSDDYTQLMFPEWQYPIQPKQALDGIGLQQGDPVTLSFWAKNGQYLEDGVTLNTYEIYPRFTFYRADGTYSIGYGGTHIMPNTEGFTTFTHIIPADCVELEFAIQRTGAGTGSPKFPIEIRRVKGEWGNIHTAWSLPPSDIDDKIGDAVETITAEYNTAITNSETEINLQVSKTLYGDTADPNDTGGLRGEMISYTDTKVTATEDSFNIKFTNIDTTTGEHEDKLAEVYSYFKFEPTGLNIGKSDSPLQINISNSQMDFIDNGKTIAYVNGQKMYISTAEILNSIVVGNHKIEKYNTNITLVKWVGG